MRLFLFRFLFVLSIGALVAGEVKADPVTAFTNIPPPGNFKTGGSSLSATGRKALIFTTPQHSNAEVVSITVGLSNNTTQYPNTADIKILIYSVNDITGKPDIELYSTPMQYGLNVTGTGTLFTFSIPNWRLTANTQYALALESTGVGTNTKWGNIEVGGVDQPAVAQNGFLFNNVGWTDFNGTPAWVTAGGATNNAVTMSVLLIPEVPSLSEWTQLLLSLMTIMIVGWHFHRERSYSPVASNSN